jgi:hypothetical protein
MRIGRCRRTFVPRRFRFGSHANEDVGYHRRIEMLSLITIYYFDAKFF